MRLRVNDGFGLVEKVEKNGGPPSVLMIIAALNGNDRTLPFFEMTS